MMDEIRYVDAPCPVCALLMHLDMSDLSDQDPADRHLECEGCRSPLAVGMVGGRPAFTSPAGKPGWHGVFRFRADGAYQIKDAIAWFGWKVRRKAEALTIIIFRATGLRFVVVEFPRGDPAVEAAALAQGEAAQ